MGGAVTIVDARYIFRLMNSIPRPLPGRHIFDRAHRQLIGLGTTKTPGLQPNTSPPGFNYSLWNLDRGREYRGTEHTAASVACDQQTPARKRNSGTRLNVKQMPRISLQADRKTAMNDGAYLCLRMSSGLSAKTWEK